MKTKSVLSMIIWCTFCLTACQFKQNPAQNHNMDSQQQIYQTIKQALLQIKDQQPHQKREGYQTLLKLAEQNQPDAIFNLGQLYIAPSPLAGIIQTNSQAAETLLLKSAQMNHFESQIALGMNYYFGGHGFEKNDEKSCFWLSKADTHYPNQAVVKKIMKMACAEK